MRFLAFLGIFLLLSAPPSFADSTTAGLTGLGEMRTPDTIGGYRSEIYVAGRYRLLTEEMGKQIIPALGYTQGLGDTVEVGAQIPFRVLDNVSGLSDIPLAAKYRFLDWDFLRLSASAQVELPTASQSKSMGTGKLGFAGEFQGGLVFGALELNGSLSYGKSDYCPGCQHAGLQSKSAINPLYVPTLGLAGAASYSYENYKAFAELHLDNSANGDQGGKLAGDADSYVLIGGRSEIVDDVGATAFAGVGFPADSANTKVLAGLLVSYKFGEKTAVAALPKEETAEAVQGAPVPPKAPVLPIVAVYDGCKIPAETNKLIALLKKGKLDVRSAGAAPATAEMTSIYITEASIGPGSEVARAIPGKQKMLKENFIAGGVAVKVVAGCDLAPKPARAPAPVVVAPAVPKKPKIEINISVINGCGKPGMAEDAAKTLLLNGYNVTKIADEPKPTTPGPTEVRFRPEYQAEAMDISAKLPGRQRMFIDRSLPADTDIKINVGCE